MVVTFTEENHHYESDPPCYWISSTKIAGLCSNEFDAVQQSVTSSHNHGSKWFGIEPEAIQEIWVKENLRSTTVGHKFHAHQERKALSKHTKDWRGKKLWIFGTPTIDGIKTARKQELEIGFYLEHICYDEETGACGQTDLLACDGEFIDIGDYKTNKEIKRLGYGWQYGNEKMMLPPLQHLGDCNYNEQSIQLSTYMTLALKKNPHLKPGKLNTYHVTFETLSYDKWGYPDEIRVDKDGNPVVQSVKIYDLPYLKDEVDVLLKEIQKLRVVKDKK